MTLEQRFERDLPLILDDIAMGPYPDYVDGVLSTTAQRRQRASWTFPERWLPVELTTARVPQTRLPWRQVIVLVALIALLLAASALYIGSRQTTLPEPFGRASNGLVAYARDGDIYTVDPKTNRSTPITTGRDLDTSPTWSRDGTRLAFRRETGASSVAYVVDADGRSAAPVSDPMRNMSELAFSPDGSTVMFTAGTDELRETWIANTTGKPDPRRIDVGMSMVSPTFRPPEGSEIIFANGSSVEQGRGIFAVNVKTGAVRTILPAEPGNFRDWIRVSPDGSHIAYSAATASDVRNTFVVHIVGADGTGDRALPMPERATFQDGPSWSNDSQRLAVARGYADRNSDMALTVIPADGSSTGIETERGLTGCCDTAVEWAPDDTVILVSPNDLDGVRKPQLLWNPETGATQVAPWGAKGDPAWQRTSR
ncbi:MAG TPA: hypothetical protein VFN41_01650 [Candidatus Limnocylindrales bacterium]|nr:hypothetical protein [Candidatus Limnocylindrales bacterium]